MYSKNIFGFILQLHETNYFLPVISLIESDYDELGNVLKSTLTILRMIDIKTKQAIVNL